MDQQRRFREALHPLMRQIGFVCHDDVYVRGLNPEMLACTGLHIRHNPQTDTLETDVAVGVRHSGLEELVARLRGVQPGAFTPFSLGTQIGYLMPAKVHVSYLLPRDGNPSAIAGRIGGHVQAFGLPYMTAHASLEAIAKAMSVGSGGPAVSVAYRLPAALYLLGDARAAMESHFRFLERAGQRSDLWAREYERFGAAFRQLVGGG